MSQVDLSLTSAKELQNTYSRLAREAGVGATTATNKKRKKSAEVKRASRRELVRFERKLLGNMTPEILRQIIMLEVYAPRGLRDPQPIILPRILELAAESLEAAKKFAYLLIRATFFTTRQEYSPREEVPNHFLTMAFAGPWLVEGEWLPRSPFIPLANRFIDRLVEGVRRKDERARWCLEVLFRSQAQYGLIFDPMQIGQWNEEQEVLLGKALLFSPSEVSSRLLSFPYVCPAKQAEVLGHVFMEAAKEIALDIKKSADLKIIKQIPTLAFEHYLSRLWQNIEQATHGEHYGVLRNGKDKVVLQCSLLNVTGLQSFAFVGEDEEEVGGWCSYPKIHVDLFWDNFGERDITRLTITEEGEVVNFTRRTWPVEMKKAFYCILFDAYADIVLPRSEEKAEGVKREATRRRRRQQKRRCGEQTTVHPHFRTLAEGWEASAEQVARSLLVMGCPPPPGKTFVDEFDRNLPSLMGLERRSQEERWDRHFALEPVLIYNETTFQNLLDDIQSWIPE